MRPIPCGMVSLSHGCTLIDRDTIWDVDGVGTSNHVLDGVPDPPWEGQFRGEKGNMYRRPGKTAGSMEMEFGMWTSESSGRGPSHETYFRFCFVMTMRHFVKLL